MRTVVIGATGHVGTYLVPRLVRAGHDVVAVSRGERDPYQSDGAWDDVERVTLDRERAEEEGVFVERIRELDPDAVVDMICFESEQARRLVEGLEGEIQHFLHCGTVWVHGPSRVVPTTEDQPRDPFGEYGTKKAEIESYLLEKARRDGFPATVLHPGHIVGPGWMPLSPAGNFETYAYEALASGETLALPGRGLETVHHVHADDVAQAFERAFASWSAAVGESFHVTSSRAVTLRGYAREVAGWFGEEADLEFLPWDEWTETVSEEAAEATYDHVEHSPSVSIEKARERLGYEPRYTSFQAVREAVDALVADGELDVE